jgi:hypothetical protein
MRAMQKGIVLWRLVAKSVALFVALQLILVPLTPVLTSLSIYPVLGLERDRLPVSTNPAIDAALDVGNLDAMFASHVISRPKATTEYRVAILGDSAVWGLQLKPADTLPAQLNRLGLTCAGRTMRFYNLSYPRSSATKDLMILDKAMSYSPDLVLYLVTWYTLMPKTRIDHFLILQNPEEFARLGHRFDFLPKDYRPPTYFGQIAASDRALFRTIRYQFYAPIALATGREQIPGPPEERAKTLSADTTFEGLKPPTLKKAQVSLDQLVDFYDLARKTPVVLVNEPILIVSGVPNSDVRYDSYYPRWVYDQYRQYLADEARQNSWNYLDLWNSISPAYFADTPLHLTPDGQAMLAKMLIPALVSNCS